MRILFLAALLVTGCNDITRTCDGIALGSEQSALPFKADAGTSKTCIGGGPYPGSKYVGDIGAFECCAANNAAYPDGCGVDCTGVSWIGSAPEDDGFDSQPFCCVGLQSGKVIARYLYLD